MILTVLMGATLTLEHVKDSVARHFPLVQAADLDLRMARADLLAADGGFDPNFTGRALVDALGYYRDVQVDAQIEQPTPLWGTSVIAGYRLGRGSFPDYAGGSETNAYGEVRGAVNVPLLRNGWVDRRRAAIARAKLGVEAGQAAKGQTLLEVTRAASIRYFAWAGAGLRRALAEQMLKLAQARDAQIATRVSSGDLPQVERIDNERTIAQREAALVQAERAVQQAAFELSLYLRDDQGTPRVPTRDELPGELVPTPPPNESPDALARQALASRPDLRRSALTLEQSMIERDLQKNQLWPALDFRLTLSQDFGPGSPTRAPFELTAGVVFDIPLAFRLQRGRVQAAEAAVGRGEALLRLHRERINVEVRDAKSAELAAHDRHAAARRESKLALEMARLERARFELGESTILIVNLRETAALEAEARAIDAAVDAHRARIDLAAVMATLVKAPVI